MKDIYICTTVYHLLIALVKQLINNHRADLILCKSPYIAPDTLKKLQKCDIFKKIFIYEDIEDRGYQIGWVEKIIHGTSYAKKYFYSKSALTNEYWENSNIYIFNDDSFFGKWFNQCNIPYHLLEDGLNHYSITPIKKQQNYIFIRKCLGIFCGHHGLSSRMIDLEVNSKEKIPEILKKKAIAVPRANLFNQLTIQQKKILIDIFNANQINQSFNDYSNKETTLLITQPLSEDLIISHEKKIKIYQELIRRYAHGQVFIKPHPREKEDYSSIFPNSIILNLQDIPLEILDFFPNFHFTYGITAFSTSLDSLNKINHKVFMGYNWTVYHE